MTGTARLTLRFDGPAEAVGFRTFMPRFPSLLPFEMVSTDRWELELDLPADVRLEYLLEIRRGDHTISIPDPRNAELAENPFGTNSVLTGPDYRPPDWRSREVEPGQTAEIRVASRHLGGRRRHLLWSPPGTRPSTPLPLLVVHDGGDYLRYADLGRCLTVMAVDGVIPPTRVVGLLPRVRHLEYVATPGHAHHVVTEVIPHVAVRANTVGRPVVMGASLGAVAAWHAAWTHPGTFRGLLIQSGTFALDPHPQLDETMSESIGRFVATALPTPRLETVAVRQSCGVYESLIDWNRTVAERLVSASASFDYTERPTGHDWGAWSDLLAPALADLLG